MFTPEQFKDKTAGLTNIINKQLDITSGSHIDDATPDNRPSDILTEVQYRMNESSLRVLVMGKFSSGKSTFLNALMGKNLLPAKPTPTTAIIGEIRYSDSPRATLFPKNASSDEAFDVSIDDLKKYVVINNDDESDDESKESPYEKVVIEYPLELCKMGVDLVDSPGLDDPTCHDSITQNYLPSADAIVYCMNVQQAFTFLDKTEIEHLRALGYTSIIFVLNYFDLLEQNDIAMGTDYALETKEHLVNILSQYTDLGPDGIFFVGSLPALVGKITGDESKIQSSHILSVEKKLEQILFNERGRIKLIKSIYSVKKVNRDTGRFLSDEIALSTQNQVSLSNKLNDAQLSLNMAREKAMLITTGFKNGEKELLDGTRDKVRSFITSTIIPNIEPWVFECKPEEGINMLHPKRSIAEYTKKCINHLQTKIETSISLWCKNDLVPKYVKPKFQKLVEQQGTSLTAYEQDLQNVRGTLSLSVDYDGQDISSNRIKSSIVGIFTGGPGGALAGGLYGWDGLFPTIIAEVVAGVVLGVIWIFTPIGIPAAIVAFVLASLVGGVVGVSKIEEKVKKKVGAQAKEEVMKQQEIFISNLLQGVNNVILKADKAVTENLNAPVNQYQKLLDDAKKNLESEGSNLQNQIEKEKILLKDNNSMADILEDFAHEIDLSL